MREDEIIIYLGNEILDEGTFFENGIVDNVLLFMEYQQGNRSGILTYFVKSINRETYEVTVSEQ